MTFAKNNTFFSKLTFFNVLPEDRNVFIPVRAGLFMVESEGMTLRKKYDKYDCISLFADMMEG